LGKHHPPLQEFFFGGLALDSVIDFYQGGTAAVHLPNVGLKLPQQQVFHVVPLEFEESRFHLSKHQIGNGFYGKAIVVFLSKDSPFQYFFQV